MFFQDIVSTVMDRLNLTSDAARLRVGFTVNRVYKKVTAGIGLLTSRRVSFDLTIDPTDPQYADLPELTISDMEKVHRVAHVLNDSNRFTVLRQLEYEELQDIQPRAAAVPTAFAVKKVGPGEVIIRLDTNPDETFILRVNGYDHADELEDDIEPYLPSDYHDVLIEGAMSDELRKMEKPELAQIAEADYQQRLSDLRMFLAKAAYQDIYEGKRSRVGFNWNYRSPYWW